MEQIAAEEYENSGEIFMGKIKKFGICILLGFCMTAMGCGNIEQDSGESVKEKGKIEKQTEQITKENETDSQENVESEPKEKPQRIICWGDSLTYGQGGDGITYPLVLEEKTNMEVINYGIQGETARQIAIRMGVLSMTTGKFEIPETAEPVEVTLWQGDEDPIMMRLGDCAINPCKIAGVEGTLSYNASDNKYYFTRTIEGQAVTVAEDTVVETFASADKSESDIIVLFAGTNLPPDKNTVGELIDMEEKMLEYLDTERYVVVGLTSKTLIPDIEPINEALAEAFGEHFLDIRAYLLENGLSDAGIEVTEQDQSDIEMGEIPSSIRVDEVHGNSAFYQIIGQQIYEKLESLGYLSE